MEIGRLEIYYRSEFGIDKHKDISLETDMNNLGYSLYAAAYDNETEVRRLSFKEEKRDEKF